MIHIERQWAENRLTAEGRVLHERAHEGECELRDGVLIARGVALLSRKLGLIGQADVVEFHPAIPGCGVALSGRRGRWQPFPVEYKRGRPKRDRCDEIQLCAQAMCLEEMLGVEIVAGALYYGEPKRRTDVSLAANLREVTQQVALAVHGLIRASETPEPVKQAKCRNCSLAEICLPGVGRRGGVVRWIEEQLRAEN